MSDDPIVIVGPDGHGYVPIGEHERMRRKKALMTECLVKIAHEMNKLADSLEAEGSSIDEETRPAPLGDI